MPKHLLKQTALVSVSLALSFFVFFSLTKNSIAQGADTTTPTTTSTQTPSSPDGNNDWYVSDVQFDLEATDLESGVSELNYRVDGGSWQQITFLNTSNLAPNPSFETAGATSTGAQSWEATIVDPEVITTRTSAEFAPGYASNSIQIETTGGSWHGINNKGSQVPAIPFDNMTASAWFNIQNVSGVSYFKIYAELDDASIVELAQSSSLTGTTAGWVKLTVNFNVNYTNATGIYMDIGHTGPGILFVDAVTINSSLFSTGATLTVGSDSANHTLEFYSVDFAGNTESYTCTSPEKNCIKFKLDQTAPGNWSNSTAVRGVGGAEHELFVFTDVDDVTSGLSTNTDQYMYSIPTETGFGHYTNLLFCNTPWLENDWVALEDAVTVDGVNTAVLKTQKTDFCDSDWKVCKEVRFYAEDMAGNTGTKDLCLNGPWIKLSGGGGIRANHNIDMLAEAPDEDNTDGLIEVGGSTIDFFTSSQGWQVINSPIPPEFDYAKLYDLTPETKTDILDGNLVSDTDVFEVNGDLTIDNASTPPGYSSDTFDQIVFVDGNLFIAANVAIDETSTALFVVSGDVNIEKNVSAVGIALIADGNINTAYDLLEGRSTQLLTMNGIFWGERIMLQRTLQGTNNNDDPSEEFIYEPKYLIQLKQFFRNSATLWRYDQ